MATITIFRNPFSAEKEQLRICEPMAVKDAMKFDAERSLVFVNGTKRDGSWILKEDDVCLIREYPDGLTAVLITAVSIIAAYVIADAIVQGVTGQSIAEHVLLDWMGRDDTKDASDTESLKKIPQLNGAENQSGLDKPVPFVFGKHLFTPYYCGSPYTYIDPTDGSDGENQYYCALFMIGYSNIKVSDLKIGELALASNVAAVMNGAITVDGLFPVSTYKTQLEIQQANEVSLYPQKVIEEQNAAKLFCVPSSIAVPEGGGESVIYDGSPPIRRWSASYPQKVQVEIMFPSGLYGKNSSSGDKEDRTVQLKVKWRPINGSDSSWHTFPAFQNCTSSAPGTDGIIVSTFTKQVKKQMRFIAELSLAYADASALTTPNIEIYMERVNLQATDDYTADDVYWTITRTWCYDKTKSAAAGGFVIQAPVTEKLRKNTCRLGFRIKAANDITGTINKINMLVQSIARTWNGTAWTSMTDAIANKTTSSNPASVALLAMQQTYLGGDAYSDSKIDLVGMGAFYEFCASKGFTCNGVLTSQKVLRDFLSAILYTGRAQFIRKEGKYSPLVDKPITSLPVTVLNQQNTSAATNSKNFDELPNGLRISFVDEADGYATNEIYVMYDGYSYTDDGMIFQDIDLPFVTNRNQVYKLGRYFLACKKLRPETWMRTVSVEGYDIPIGSLIEVQDDTIIVGSNEGGIIKEIVQVDNILTEIVCDSSFDMFDGYSYGLKIVQANGNDTPKVRTVQVETIQGYTNRFRLATLIYMNEAIIPTVGDIAAFGEFEKITIDAIVFGKTPKDDQSFELTLLPYDDGIYTADEGAIPEFDSKITKPLPSVLLELVSVPPTGLTGADGEPGTTATFPSDTDCLCYFAFDDVNKSLPAPDPEHTAIQSKTIEYDYSATPSISTTEVEAINNVLIVKGPISADVTLTLFFSALTHNGSKQYQLINNLVPDVPRILYITTGIAGKAVVSLDVNSLTFGTGCYLVVDQDGNVFHFMGEKGEQGEPGVTLPDISGLGALPIEDLDANADSLIAYDASTLLHKKLSAGAFLWAGATIITGNTTLTGKERLLVVTTDAAVVITIPAGLALYKGFSIMRTVPSANGIAVATSGSELIEGATSFITHGSTVSVVDNPAVVTIAKTGATTWKFVDGVVSGSNSNGEYEKFSDGEMETWTKQGAAVTISTVWGTLYYAPITTPNTPSTFYNLPDVSITILGGGASIIHAVNGLPMKTKYTSGTVLAVRSDTGLNVHLEVHYHAIGRWRA